MKRLRIAVLAAGLAMMNPRLHAATLVVQEDFKSAGVRGAFLLRDGGPRASALGGAFTAVADEPGSLTVNAAGVGQLSGFGVSLAHDGAGNGLGVSEAAAAKPLGGGVVAARLALVSYGDYDVRDVSGAALGTASTSDISVAAGYARSNPEWMGIRGTWGAAVAASSESAGSVLILGAHLGWLGHFTNAMSAGVALRNAGPLPEGSPPMTVAAGGAYTFPERLARISVDAGYGVGDGLVRAAAGIELPALARPGEAGHKSPLAIRLGYRGELGAKSRGGADGVSAGLGLRRGRFQVDLAFQAHGDLGGGVRAGVTYQVRQEFLSAR